MCFHWRYGTTSQWFEGGWNPPLSTYRPPSHLLVAEEYILVRSSWLTDHLSDWSLSNLECKAPIMALKYQYYPSYLYQVYYELCEGGDADTGTDGQFDFWKHFLNKKNKKEFRFIDVALNGG